MRPVSSQSHGSLHPLVSRRLRDPHLRKPPWRDDRLGAVDAAEGRTQRSSTKHLRAWSPDHHDLQSRVGHGDVAGPAPFVASELCKRATAGQIMG
jgi:hypothetical protein